MQLLTGMWYKQLNETSFYWDDFFIHFSGPIHWGMYDKQCDGTSQSPIDITKGVELLLNQSLKKIKLTSSWDKSNFKASSSFTLENKGYTVQLTIDKDNK